MLVVTAVAAERDAVLAGRSHAVGMVDGLEVHRCMTAAGIIDVLVCGVGPVAAAVATGCALRQPYDLAVSAGIAGGFEPMVPGQVVVATAVVHADLGAQDGAVFTSMAELGWGRVIFPLEPIITATIAGRCRAVTGEILTVSTTTGSVERAAQLSAAHPDAVAEAMEGVGAYQAAKRAGVSFAEVRSISNRVGRRDLNGWKITESLDALSEAFAGIFESEVMLPVRNKP